MNSGSPRFMTRGDLTWATHRVLKQKQLHHHHTTSEGGTREMKHTGLSLASLDQQSDVTEVRDEKSSIFNMGQVRNGFA